MFLLAGSLLVTSSTAYAQAVSDDVTAIVPDDEIKNLEDAKRQGFDGQLTVGANINLTENSNVVGQVDGFSTLMGLNLIGGLDYLWGRHEIRNTLKITESMSKTPVVDEFVKSSDNVNFESLYNYFILDWMGAFGRLSFETSAFTTQAVTAEETNYAITGEDGNVQSITTDHLTLSAPLEPMSFYQSGGLFAEPVQKKWLSLSTRLGMGARQTIADGVLAITDDADTPAAIEAKELQNVYQGGAEGFVGLQGKLYKDRVSYEVGASALIPFLNNDPENRAPMDLLRYGVSAQVATSIFTWASLNYQFRMLKDPQLLDETQVQHALLLTFNYTFVERNGGIAEPTAAEKLEAAETALKEANAECADLKKQAADMKKEAEEAKVEEREAALEAAKKAEEDAKAKEAEAQDAKDEAEQSKEEAEESKEEAAKKAAEAAKAKKEAEDALKNANTPKPEGVTPDIMAPTP